MVNNYLHGSPVSAASEAPLTCVSLPEYAQFLLGQTDTKIHFFSQQ